jgi:hypothetical protein
MSSNIKVALNIIYSLGTPVSSTNKTDRHDVTEILLKVALNTINHQYHIICMQNTYDNQFGCNIILLIKIFLENLCPHLRYKFRFVNPRAIVFLMACLRYHTVLWVDESEYLPDEGITVLLFLSTVVTHILYETSHFFGENTNAIRADSLSFLRPQSQKSITS